MQDEAMNLASGHVADRAMCLHGFQLFQAPFQLIERVHGQSLTTFICPLHKHLAF